MVGVEFTITLLIVGLAVGVNIFSAVVRRTLTDVAKLKRLNAELQAYQRELMAAVRSRDKAKEEKLRRKKPQMDQMRAQVSMASLKPTMVTIIPFLLIFWFVLPGIAPLETVVALSPVDLNIVPLGITNGPEHAISVFWWYFIASLAFGTVVLKLFSLS